MKTIIILALALISTTAYGASVSTTETVGAGGISILYNKTTKSYTDYPQCFPYVLLVEYYKGNVLDAMMNQSKCREQRFIDFGI